MGNNSYVNEINFTITYPNVKTRSLKYSVHKAADIINALSVIHCNRSINCNF